MRWEWSSLASPDDHKPPVSSGTLEGTFPVLPRDFPEIWGVSSVKTQVQDGLGSSLEVRINLRTRALIVSAGRHRPRFHAGLHRR